MKTRRHPLAAIPLKGRIIALFVVFALADLSTGVVVMMANGQESVASEVRIAQQTAAFVVSEMVEHDVNRHGDGVRPTPQGLEALRQLRLRHTTIQLFDPDGILVVASVPYGEPGSTPDWFAARFRPKDTVRRYTAPYGTIVVTVDPRAEIDEAWDGILGTTLTSLAIDIEVVLLLALLTTLLLRPLRSFETQLARLEAGAYDIAPDPGNVPELVRIGTRLTALRDSLRRLEAENRDLATQLVTVQDEERQYLAREIHDELGPHVFAIRVDAQAVARADLSVETQDDIRKRGEAILQSAEYVHKLGRRILKRLRPMALDHMQLSDVLRNMVETLQGQQPGVIFSLRVNGALDGLSETINVTLCRTVQEACLNSIRHAQPHSITVRLDRLDSAVQVEVADDGSGIDRAPKPEGLGLSAMRQRVQALGGRLTVGATRSGGTLVQAVIPLDTNRETET